MSSLFIGGLIFLAFGFILLSNPWQLFSRNGPAVVLSIKTNNKYKKILRLLAIIFLILGSLIEFVAFILLLPL